ncbi:hypothetical protein [Frigoribacterium sp. VKM Ac-2836]|uniref:hypothetical protein n=1 Tax=Frigoribacterium sp. VKM Ac-2836 TaxID=2739014 RepID=UPI0015668E5A|nr:hypothetical protein [Frigoribacterium sp. VKM Ac-2836]NRD25581.1 hypothetical protein [Frigoribacterium sp. VKM Ac-2836]
MRPARLRVALVVGLVVLLVGSGTGTSWALWSASTSFDQTATLGTLSTSVDGVSSLGTTYESRSASVTAPVTLRNTGNVAATGTIQASTAPTNTPASTTLLSEISVVTWPVDSTTACTPSATAPSTALAGTWASPPAPPSVVLPAGGSASWCYRTTPTADAPASATVDASLTTTVTAGSWTASSSAGFSQATADSLPPVYCTDTGAWYVTIRYDKSTRPLDTYYGLSIDGTLVADPDQGYNGYFQLDAAEISTDLAPDGRVLTRVVVLDQAGAPTSTVVSSGYVTFGQHSTSTARTVVCS